MTRKAVLAPALWALASMVYAEWVAIGPDGGSITALALDPQQPATLYALPYEYPDSPRVLKTTNGGGAWAGAGVLPDYGVSAVLVNPHQSGYLYAMASSTVWASTDGGGWW